MTVLQTDIAPVAHIAEVAQLVKPANGFHVEPRCRVCRNPTLSRKINELLTTGASYAMVLRAIQGENDDLSKRDRVTIDSIRNHTTRHFPVQNGAKATYRAILEQRARENAIDFVNGVATALTPMALYETVMVKAYENLVDPDTKVDVNTGMIAAGRLHAMTEARANGTSMSEMRVEVGRIIAAVKSTVPESMWPEIMRKMDADEEASEPLAYGVEEFDPADDGFEDEEFDE
jgi:hypothetical protein